MLVVTRKSGEKILIGDDIVIHCISNKDGRMKIGIEAPKSVSIMREEILSRYNRDGSKRDQ